MGHNVLFAIKNGAPGQDAKAAPILAKLAIVVDRLRADAAEYASSFLRRYGIIKVVGVLPHTLREAKVCRKSRKKDSGGGERFKTFLAFLQF